MRFSCDSCGAQYMISDEKVGANGVKVRCKKCSTILTVRRVPSVSPLMIAPDAPAPVLAANGPAAEVAAAGAPETTPERDLGSAFDSAFAALAQPRAETPAAVAAAEPAAPTAEAPRAIDPEAFTDWYVAIDDNQVGPLEAAEVRQRWEAGEVGPDTLGWRPGMADWLPISAIPEMAQYLAPVPRRSKAAATIAAEKRAEVGSSTPAPSGPAATPTIAPAVLPLAAAAAHPVANGAVNGANGVHGVNGVNGANGAWKPAAATALAALASEEIASLHKPAKPDGAAAKTPNSLLDRMELPDGGVDPTNLLPLPIKGLDGTGEMPVPRKPAAPEPTELRRLKKSASRSVVLAAVALGVVLVVGAAVLFVVLRSPRGPAPAVARAPVAAQAPSSPAAPAPAAAPAQVAAAQPPPQVASAAAPQAAPAPVASAAAPPVAAAPAAPAPAPAEAAKEEPAAAPSQAAPEPEPKAPARVAAADREPPQKAARPHRRERAERPTRIAKPTSAQRVAAAAPAPEARPAVPAPAPAPAVAAAEPPRRKPAGDPLLDVGGDDELEKELSQGAPKKRSVYVPPAIGSASDLPESVSVSQINESVVGQKAALLRCIEQQKAADPDTRGTLKMRWVINGDGGVRDVRVLSDEFSRQPIAPCISGVVKGIRFPRSKTAGQEVVFPFKF